MTELERECAEFIPGIPWPQMTEKRMTELEKLVRDNLARALDWPPSRARVHLHPLGKRAFDTKPKKRVFFAWWTPSDSNREVSFLFPIILPKEKEL